MAAPYVLEQRDARPVVRYASTRLAFRRAAIELLPSDGLLEVLVRPTMGSEFTITMTRADFERDFSNVTRSKSWAKREYNYRDFPEAARRYVTHGTPPSQPSRQRQRNTSTRVRSASTLPSTDGITDVAEWAAIWSTRVGLVDAWRDAWRPERVRLLLVAESHMGELS
jgi:hypothetical protein